jgi:hypothetical protein
MQGQTTSALAITTFAAAVSLFSFISSNTAASAATCLSAPKPPAPEGKHWFYRLDRETKLKCWYVGSKDKDTRSKTARAAPQTDDDEEPVAPQRPARGVTKAEPQSAPAMFTKDASQVSPDSIPTQPPTSPSVVAQAPAPSMNTAEQQPVPTGGSFAQEQTPGEPQITRVAEEQPAAQSIAPQPAAPVVRAPEAKATSTPIYQFVFLALAMIALIGGAVLYVMEMKRRRHDVLNLARRDTAPDMTADRVRVTVDAPTLAPAQESPLRHHDDVDEILQRLARRRRAA